jgi:hypothetical protein
MPTVQGRASKSRNIGAFARALEHINLAWALAGAIMRLPILSSIIQLIVDASGLGPRKLDYSQCHPTKSL